MKSLLNIEEHPLEPFLPINAKLLMLGSFPPQKKRWSMEFFYPNLQNDMWRIFGIIFFQNKDHFLNPDKKVFDKERIIDLLIKNYGSRSKKGEIPRFELSHNALNRKPQK